MKITSLIIGIAMAAISASINAASNDDKPFAEKRIVLQISDQNPLKQTQVLNVASNLIKHYGSDKVDIEIVAFGPGLRLLLDGNSNQSRMNGLGSEGVRFSACKNTIEKFAKNLGYQPKLVEQATPVSAGVVRILELQGQDYTLVKP